MKVPAHSDDDHNNQVDSLAKSAHSCSQTSFAPRSVLTLPSLLSFNGLPIDSNLRGLLKDIFAARNLLSFCSLNRFVLLGDFSSFDWAGIDVCLTSFKDFASHKNG